MLEIFAVDCVLRVSLLMKCFISQGNTGVPHMCRQSKPRVNLANCGIKFAYVISILMLWCCLLFL